MILKKIFRNIEYLFLLFYWHKIKKYKIIYPPQGLGDILVLLRVLNQYKIKNYNKKVAIIVKKQHFYDLCKIFNNYDKLFLFSYISERLIPKYILNIGKMIYSEHSHFEKFEEAICKSIGLENITTFEVPVIKKNKNIESLFDNGIYKRDYTVLITPEATTSKNCFPENYWLNCADKLSKKGYQVVFNCKNKIGNYPCVFYNLTDTINFLNNAGHLLGFRSGLLDVLGFFCDAHMVVIYPNNWKKEDMPYLNGFDNAPNERYMEDGSLNRLFPQKYFEEFIYDDKIDILKYFKRNG